MALSKEDKEFIAEAIAASKGEGGNTPPGNENIEESGEVVILKGEVAKDFLAAMKGNDDGGEPKEPKKEDRWGGFGKKYFGGGGE